MCLNIMFEHLKFIVYRSCYLSPIYLSLMPYVLRYFILSLRVQLRRYNLRNCVIITFVRSSLNPWGNNVSTDEGH